MVATSAKQIQRYGETIEFTDKGLDGYRIDFPDSACFCDFSPSFITFPSFDDYLKIYNIDNWLYFLYSENSHTNSYLVREDEKLFYNNLKETEKIIKDCKNMKIVTNDATALLNLFEYIDRFICESRDGFKHNNKMLENKFHKVAEKLEKLCDI